jgi:hypothetical protein
MRDAAGLGADCDEDKMHIGEEESGQACDDQRGQGDPVPALS